MNGMDMGHVWVTDIVGDVVWDSEWSKDDSRIQRPGVEVTVSLDRSEHGSKGLREGDQVWCKNQWSKGVIWDESRQRHYAEVLDDLASLVPKRS